MYCLCDGLQRGKQVVGPQYLCTRWTEDGDTQARVHNVEMLLLLWLKQHYKLDNVGLEDSPLAYTA